MSNQQTMQWAKEETQGFNETKKQSKAPRRGLGVFYLRGEEGVT